MNALSFPHFYCFRLLRTSSIIEFTSSLPSGDGPFQALIRLFDVIPIRFYIEMLIQINSANMGYREI